MKYPLLVAILGLTEISLKAGFFGSKNFATFTEEQLDTIEGALEKQDTSVLITQIEHAKQDIAEHKERLEIIENAVTEALKLNELEAAEKIEESIRLLGTTCKEYGQKKSVHTLAKQDGKEANLEDNGLIDGYLNPNDEHNKLLNEI